MSAVREALNRAAVFAAMAEDRVYDAVSDAQDALTAHEQELAELVKIAKKFATGAVGHYDFDALTAALRPFTGDEK